MTDKYCPRIHHGLTLSDISDTGITYAACCWAQESINEANLLKFNHPTLVKLREENASGSLPQTYCKTCITQEHSDKKSMRQGYLETHGAETYDDTIQYLDINIDYTCNLACVTCGPDLSTTWRNELKLPGRQVRPNLEQFFNNHIKTLDLTHLKEVRVWGGEPLLTNTHVKILELIIEQGNAANVKLMYNTNGTKRIDEKIKKLIEQFKFARISFSIDEIGDQFEYLRYPAKWNKVEENLLWWKDNLPHNSMLSFTVTASVLNVLTLDNVYNWWSKNFTKSIFGDDIEIYTHQAFGIYGLESMPVEMISRLQSIDNYCQPWIQSLKTSGSADNIKKINDTLRANDIRRGQNFALVFPDAASFLGYQK